MTSIAPAPSSLFLAPRANSCPVVVLTGGSSGIGRELVRLYRERGFHVVTCARTAEEREESGLTLLAADVAREEDRERLVRVAREQGRVVGLINNAAIQRSYPFREGAAHARDLEDEIRINLLAPLALGHALARDLVASGGFVAQVSSGLAYIPLGRSPVYAATKAALSHYTRSLRYQAPGLRVVEIVLPLVDTAMTQGRGSGKLSAEDAARRIVAGLDSRRETIWVGKAMLLPWVLRLVPRLVARLMNRAAASEATLQLPNAARPR